MEAEKDYDLSLTWMDPISTRKEHVLSKFDTVCYPITLQRILPGPRFFHVYIFIGSCHSQF